jgi:hypothetical protein
MVEVNVSYGATEFAMHLLCIIGIIEDMGRAFLHTPSVSIDICPQFNKHQGHSRPRPRARLHQGGLPERVSRLTSSI